MKPEVFDRPGLLIERHRLREGPPVHYVCWKPYTSVFCADRSSVLKFFKWPRGTPTGDALREWLDQFVEADAALHAKVGNGLDLDMERIKAEGFGPEAHSDDEPQANTKMIT
jgi:hypothetical protein